MTRFLIFSGAALGLYFGPATRVSAQNPDWADAQPTAWHQLARAESLLSAPEPPNPVTVCIVDSGVNMTPDLEGVVVERLAYDGGDPGDTYPQEGIDDGHGTYVATFLAGQVNGWGGAGLWPRAKIVSVRVFRLSYTARVRSNGRFTLIVATKAPPSAINLRYRGDARHAPSIRRVRVVRLR